MSGRAAKYSVARDIANSTGPVAGPSLGPNEARARRILLALDAARAGVPIPSAKLVGGWEDGFDLQEWLEVAYTHGFVDGQRAKRGAKVKHSKKRCKKGK